jgi:bifunctional N-acetylglucosamine-1-phosphate-uridyltransferase/glucosamine-1-phosphate-acetyltransferase GlmU-like protein
MENKNFYGNWYGEFTEVNQKEVKIIFTEVIFIKNKIMKLMAKIFLNIEKKQEKYINDLINELKKIK